MLLTLLAFETPGPAGDVSSTVHAALTLLLIAVCIGVLTRFVHIPYTVALVLAGLGLAALHTPISNVRLTPSLVLLVSVPPLLFRGGLDVNIRLLWREIAPITLLVLPGVGLTIGLVALGVKAVWDVLDPQNSQWRTAILLGAIVAPTDPISVLAVFKRLDVPERVKTMVQGESLFNDGVAAAVFTVLLQPAAGGLGHALTSLGLECGIGLGVGVGTALVASVVLKRLNDHTLENAITVSLAWGAFLVAHHLSGSGVIATATAGLVIGGYAINRAMSRQTREVVTGFWDGLEFLINSFVFLLVGFELADPEIGGLVRLTDPLVLAIAATMLAGLYAGRIASVFGACWLNGRLHPGRRWRRGWRTVIGWAGLRGALSVALSLSVPEGYARDVVIPATFLVVVFTLVMQGLSISAVLRHFGQALASPAAHPS